ncbi:putative ribonuclease H-like domain-containing protein [Tanacetum coccineum]
MVPRAVLMKTGLRSLNTAKANTTCHPKLQFIVLNNGTCPISQTLRNLMEDMLPLGEEPNEEKLLVKELLKLNSDLFTDNGCFVLSPDFKLADESPVTLDESMLWHRRLELVVACLKGKQHKASCKSKIQNSITQPLFMLHIFTWVFFLATTDETSGILKSFITEIENLVDKKVKIIKCDNGTEFKNKVMSEFYEQKGIKREYSIARTPQQNGAAERRNRILIEPAKTIGRTPALSFMRPFGCHVTILNTLDYLAVLMKSDEGFFIRYSMNSKAFRVYNIRTRKVEENLHIRFLEDKPIIQLIGPKWLFWILIVLTKSINLVPVGCRSSQDYILMPMWKDGSLFDSSLKNASNDEPQPSSDAGKKDDEGRAQKSNPSIKRSKLDRSYARRAFEFKLQQVWTLVDLPLGKRAIEKDKKDKRKQKQSKTDKKRKRQDKSEE